MNFRSRLKASSRLTSAAGAVLLVVSAGAVGTWFATSASADSSTVIMASGDIAEGGATSQADAMSTGNLVRAANPNFVMTIGDEAYPLGSPSDFANKYQPTWGSFKAITRPAPGNHEYDTPGGTGYIGYFGAANVTNPVDGGVYYAFDVAPGWRAYSLNSEISMSASSAQYAWLNADLNAHPGVHILAQWHQARYLNGSIHSDNTSSAPIWALLQTHQADIVLGGHEHSYQRFSKMTSANVVSATGIREFVAGAGGNQTYPLGSGHVGFQVGQDKNYGVLKLTLHNNSYDWAFLASGRGFNGGPTAAAGAVLDSGTDVTNIGGVVPPPTTTPPTTT
ncbi:MAG: metallophosphoesterase, partial [Actinomycetota bacterium]